MASTSASLRTLSNRLRTGLPPELNDKYENVRSHSGFVCAWIWPLILISVPTLAYFVYTQPSEFSLQITPNVMASMVGSEKILSNLSAISEAIKNVSAAINRSVLELSPEERKHPSVISNTSYSQGNTSHTSGPSGELDLLERKVFANIVPEFKNKGHNTKKGKNYTKRGRRWRYFKNTTQIHNAMIELYTEPPEETSRRPNLTKNCDIYSGKWLYDESYPLWRPENCPFEDHGFDCTKKGRSNLDYMQFRWQPFECNLPRFDAEQFRQAMRNQVVMFVGDSLAKNQFESLLCMAAQGADPSGIRELTGSNDTNSLHPGVRYNFQETNLTIQYYKCPWLVATLRPADFPPFVKAAVQVDVLDQFWAREAMAANILVLNLGHSLSEAKLKKMHIYFAERKQLQLNMTAQTAFRKILGTVAKWEASLQGHRPRIFFRGYSPVNSGKDHRSKARCDSVFPMRSTEHVSRDPSRFQVKPLFEGAGSQVEFLDITALSQLRKDGHFGRVGSRYDCSHWCLPGLPDTWNELLFAHMRAKEIPPFN